MSLSEQQLIDCDRGGQDEGCDGGFEDDALLYIAKNGGEYAVYMYIACLGLVKYNNMHVTV